MYVYPNYLPYKCFNIPYTNLSYQRLMNKNNTFDNDKAPLRYTFICVAFVQNKIYKLITKMGGG